VGKAPEQGEKWGQGGAGGLVGNLAVDSQHGTSVEGSLLPYTEDHLPKEGLFDITA
jgi:hypothetical protein